MHMLIGHLPDFSRALPRRPGGEHPAGNPAAVAVAQPVPPPASVAPPASVTPRPPVPDLTAIAEEAAARGRREGEASARIAFEQQREDEKAQTEQRLAAERKSWIDDESARLVAAIDSGLNALRSELSDSLVRILTPFLHEAVRERALSEMAALINDTLTSSDMPVLRVTGAADLIEQLRSRIDPGAPVTFETGGQSDVVAIVGATTLETQMQAWAARLAAAAGDRA